MGWLGISDESGLEKKKKGSIKKHTHAAILIITWTIFFFNVMKLYKCFLLVKAKRDRPDNPKK
jgi:hypothetical protein